MAAGGSVTRQNRRRNLKVGLDFFKFHNELKLFYYKRAFVINAITKFKSCPAKAKQFSACRIIVFVH